MRFLISRLSSLGDVVCTLPVAVALRNKWPECEIVWAVDPRYVDVVTACSSVTTVVPVKPKFSMDSLPISEGEFDAALDMQGLLKSAVVVGRANARLKLGYHWQREGASMFSAAVKPDPTSLHVVDQYVDVARELGAETDRAEFGLVPAAEAQADVRLMLGPVGSKFVVVNAGAGWATKRWPAESFAHVIKGLDAVGIETALVGGSDAAAREAGENVHSECEKLGVSAVSFLGKTSVAQLIALIKESAAHLGGDTGSTHIAAALGVPAVGLYSITRPERCCPYGQIERTHYNPSGLAHIEPEAVLETLLKAVSG